MSLLVGYGWVDVKPLFARACGGFGDGKFVDPSSVIEDLRCNGWVRFLNDASSGDMERLALSLVWDDEGASDELGE